jgi:hypothetical protein
MKHASGQAVSLLKKLCVRFPAASRDEIFKKFWDLARDDKDILHSATSTGFEGYADNIFAKTMKRLRPPQPRPHRREIKVWRADF